jgi:hypothetical protein
MRPWRPAGLRDAEASTFSRQSVHRWRCDCQPFCRIFSPESFLVIIYIKGGVNPRTIMRLERIGKLKKKLVASSELEPATFRLAS